MYFWLDGPDRARLWAEQDRRCADPAVVAADLDVSRCLDLTRPLHQRLLRETYDRLLVDASKAGQRLVENLDVVGDPNRDRKKRLLDRLVINFACQEIKEAADAALAMGVAPVLPPFTSVRGVFQEGAPVYPGAGFHQSSHVQVAIRDPACISNVRLLS